MDGMAEPMPEPVEVIASAVGAHIILRESVRQIAAGAIGALAKGGYAIVPTAELERLQEIASASRGRFPRGEVIKPDRDRDFYVVGHMSAKPRRWPGRAPDARGGLPGVAAAPR